MTHPERNLSVVQRISCSVNHRQHGNQIAFVVLSVEAKGVVASVRQGVNTNNIIRGVVVDNGPANRQTVFKAFGIRQSHAFALGVEGSRATPGAWCIAKGTHIDVIDGGRIKIRQAVRIVFRTGYGRCCGFVWHIIIVVGDIDIPCGFLAASGPAEGGACGGFIGNQQVGRLKAAGTLLEEEVVEEEVPLIIGSVLHSDIFGFGRIVGRETLVARRSSDFVAPSKTIRIVVRDGVTHLEGFHTLGILHVIELHMQAVHNTAQLGRDEILWGILCVVEDEEVIARVCKV